MATTRRRKKVEEPVQEEVTTPVQEEAVQSTQEEIVTSVQEEKKPEVKTRKARFSIGSIVFISSRADTDLNGFKLFPQYKKYTYTVEAYDEHVGIYTLRRLNLTLRLPESLILAPEERAHDSLHRRQF